MKMNSKMISLLHEKIITSENVNQSISFATSTEEAPTSSQVKICSCNEEIIFDFIFIGIHRIYTALQCSVTIKKRT